MQRTNKETTILRLKSLRAYEITLDGRLALKPALARDEQPKFYPKR